MEDPQPSSVESIEEDEIMETIKKDQVNFRLTKELRALRWEEFKAKFNRKYSSKREENFRKRLFLKKLKSVEEHNQKYDQGLVTFKIGINQFSDYTEEERQGVSKSSEK